MKKFLLLMLLAPAALSAAADSGADASVVVRKEFGLRRETPFPAHGQAHRPPHRPQQIRLQRRGGARHHGLLRHDFERRHRHDAHPRPHQPRRDDGAGQPLRGLFLPRQQHGRTAARLPPYRHGTGQSGSRSGFSERSGHLARQHGLLGQRLLVRTLPPLLYGYRPQGAVSVCSPNWSCRA